jgi:hypothetical protein
MLRRSQKSSEALCQALPALASRIVSPLLAFFIPTQLGMRAIRGSAWQGSAGPGPRPSSLAFVQLARDAQSAAKLVGHK